MTLQDLLQKFDPEKHRHPLYLDGPSVGKEFGAVYTDERVKELVARFFYFWLGREAEEVERYWDIWNLYCHALAVSAGAYD